jgi:hypothetical protein
VADRRRAPSERPLRRRSIGTVISAWPSRKNSGSFAGRVPSSGVRSTSPGRAGRTMRGVTMMTRSVSFFW